MARRSASAGGSIAPARTSAPTTTFAPAPEAEDRAGQAIGVKHEAATRPAGVQLREPDREDPGSDGGSVQVLRPAGRDG